MSTKGWIVARATLVVILTLQALLLWQAVWISCIGITLAALNAASITYDIVIYRRERSAQDEEQRQKVAHQERVNNYMDQARKSRQEAV